MNGLRSEWDAEKADVNARKHCIALEEAQTVFEDDLARLRSDPDHSDDEDRFLLLGMSSRLRLLVVVHASKLKRQVTIRLDASVIDYFKELSEETEIPCQTLINVYLKDCASAAG